MKKFYLLLLCCVIFLCGCSKRYENNNELSEMGEWLKKEAEEQDMIDSCKFIEPNFPIALSYYYMGKLQSKIKLTDCDYEFYTIYDELYLKILLKGEMIYGNNEYTVINYKIKDNEGYVVEVDHYTLDIMSKGDKFKDYSIIVKLSEPGTYTIDFFDET